MVIGDSVKVELNHDGELVFGGVPNPRGDFTMNYQLETGSRNDQLQVESAKISDRGSFTDAHPYQVEFVERTPPEPGKFSYMISKTDVNGDLIPAMGPSPYTPGDKMTVDGVDIVIKGEAKKGDVITLNSAVKDGTGQDELGVFDILNRAMTWLETDGHNANGQANMADILGELDKLRSGMEDLDYAQATGEFSQIMVALQATQTMFGKVQSMSLFNYI